MNILAFSLCIIYLIIWYFIMKKKFAKTNLLNPVILFFSLWSLILFFSLLNLYGIYKPSDEAYFLIILMLTFFFIGSIGYLFFAKTKFKKRIEDIIKTKLIKYKLLKNRDDTQIKPRFNLLYILIGILIILTLIDCVIVIKALIDGTPMWKIRGWRMAPYGISSNPILDRRSFLEETFRSVILAPLEIIIPPITAYYLFNKNNKKTKYRLLIMSIAILVLSSIAGGGGRLGFLYYVGCFALSFWLMIKNSKNYKDKIRKYKKIIVIVSISAFLLVIILTNIRTSAGFIKQFYTYFALAPTLLSIWLPEIKTFSRTYGMLTTFGVHSYFFRGLEKIGLDALVPNAYNNSYNYMLKAEVFRNTGYGVANAFVSPVYYFYIDGGYPFVCIASLIFGFIISGIYSKIIKNINVKTFTIYALIMYGIFVTFMRIQTCIPSYIISFILVYIILPSSPCNSNKQKSKESNRKDDVK